MRKCRLIAEIRAITVDQSENLSGSVSPLFPNGIEFWIYREPHDWAVDELAQKSSYYTIEVSGQHYNVPAKMLEPNMEQIDRSIAHAC